MSGSMCLSGSVCLEACGGVVLYACKHVVGCFCMPVSMWWVAFVCLEAFVGVVPQLARSTSLDIYQMCLPLCA